MVPLEKSFGEFPEFLQVGGLSKIFTILELIFPLHDLVRKIVTVTPIKQDQTYYIKFGNNIFRNKFITGEIMEETKEDPPKLGKISKNKIIVPNLLKKVSI